MTTKAKPTPPSSIIGENLIIEGDINAKGPVQIDGQIEGNVNAPRVAIRGRLIGSIQADAVVLHSECYVAGDIFYRTLIVESGAHFDGNSLPEPKES